MIWKKFVSCSGMIQADSDDEATGAGVTELVDPLDSEHLKTLGSNKQSQQNKLNFHQHNIRTTLQSFLFYSYTYYRQLMHSKNIYPAGWFYFMVWPSLNLTQSRKLVM